MAEEAPRPPPDEHPTADLGDVSAQLSALLAQLARTPELPVDAAQGWSAGLKPGDVIGKFVLQRELGRGGFGVVYEALDRDLGRTVAFKAIRPGSRLASRSDDLLRREAEAVARLNHPNIVTLHDFGRGPSGPFLIFELLRGRTLAEELRAGPMAVATALDVAVDVARVLAHAHAAGVVHRDLKPANVFLGDDGAVKVLDFGLAYLFGRGGLASGGTPAYMAPEQWRAEPGDERTDLFSLGVLLHQMISGAVPYKVSRERSEALDPGPPPELSREAAPAPLRRLVQTLLEKDPARRPATAQETLDALLAARRALVRPGSRRARLAWAVGLAAAVAIAGVAGWRALRPAPLRPGERVVVAMADVENGTGDRELDGLSGLLATSLEQSRLLAVVTRSRMLDTLRRLGREAPDRLGPEVARDVGRALQARALLLATVRRFDQLYTVEVQALDPGSDERLFTLREEGSGKDSIPAMIDRVSERTRRELREDRADIRASEVRVAEAITPNLEAYQHYFAGLDCLDRPSRRSGDDDAACMGEFRKAVALDPDFALAHYQLSGPRLAAEFTPTDAERTELAAALAHPERLPAKERLLVSAWGAHLAGKDDDAIAQYREAVKAFPDEKPLLFLAGDLAFHRDRLADAATWLGRVLELDPTAEYALDHLAQTLAVLGRRDELAGWLRTWSAMAPTPALLRALVRAHLGLGQPTQALEVARRAAAAGPTPFALQGLVWTLTYSGDYAALEAELRRREPGLSLGMRAWLAHAVAAQGRRGEAARVIEALVRGASSSHDDQVSVRFISAQHRAGDGDAAGLWADARAVAAVDSRMAGLLAPLLARVGDLAHAGELAAGLEPGSPGRELYLAIADWKQGKATAARARLDALEARTALPLGCVAPAFFRAEIAAEEGLDVEALEALDRLERLPFQPYWRSWTYPQALLLRSRVLERLGRRDQARAAVERLLTLWSRADAGLPLIKEARAEAERLRGSPARGTPDTERQR